VATDLIIDDLLKFGFERITIDCLRTAGINQLRSIQEESLQKGLLDGKSFLISTPSGSGKTLIGELAAINNILRNRKKSIYLIPLRALANEKYQYFSRIYSPLNLNITMAVGDQEITTAILQKSDLIIMTFEKFDSLLRKDQHNSWTDRIGTIIIDEVHILGELKRGPRLENLILRIYRLTNMPQIVSLSATIENPHDFISWFQKLESKYKKSDFEFIIEEKRPIELKYSISVTSNKLSEISNISRKILDINGQILIFTNTRKDTKNICIALIKMMPDLKFNSPNKDFQSIVEKWGYNLDEVSEEIINALINGIGYHHAGLSSNEKSLVEFCFREGFVKILSATTTLSAGVNTPARAIILKEFMVYSINSNMSNTNTKSMKKFNKVPMDRNVFHQICGRAGRPGYDDFGNAYILAKNVEESLWIEDNYFTISPKNKFKPVYDKLESSLSINRKILHEIVLLNIFETKMFNTQDLIDFIQDSFMWQQYSNTSIPIEAYLNLNSLKFLTILKTLGSKIHYLFLKQVKTQIKIIEFLPYKILKLAINYRPQLSKNFESLIDESENVEIDKFSELHKLLNNRLGSNEEINITFSNDNNISCNCSDQVETMDFSHLNFEKGTITKFCLDQTIALYYLKQFVDDGIDERPDIELDLGGYEDLVLDSLTSIESLISASIFPKSIIGDLEEFRMIERNQNDEDDIKCNQLGKIVIQNYMIPSLADYIVRGLDKIIQTTEFIELIDLIPIISNYLKQRQKREIHELYDIINLWMNENSLSYMIEFLQKSNSRNSLYSNDLISYFESITRLIKFIVDYLKNYYPEFDLHLIEQLHQRIKYGIKIDLIPWMEIFKNDDPKMFRSLVNLGISHPKDLLKKNYDQISSYIHITSQKFKEMQDNIRKVSNN
jgi:replicative superfamily II helicase